MLSVMPVMAGPADSGSSDQRRLLARFFIETHVDFTPEAIRWPTLQGEALARLVHLPFWQEAVSTEAMTSQTVAAATALEADPLLRRAIALQGFEEQRHARLLQALTTHFGIPISPPERHASSSLERDFLFAGFGECFDSFFAFGLFRLAQSSGYFPAELVQIFEPIIQEEARHILFFVNWVRYRRRLLRWWQRPLFRLRCGWIILQQVLSRVHTARSLGANPAARPAAATDNFTLSAHRQLGEPVTLRRLLQLCLQESERRLSPYDARLARPRLVPRLAGALYRLIDLWPHR